MSNPPTTYQIQIESLKQSIENENLVIITGTGLSQALTDNSYSYLSWIGLIKSGLQYAKDKGVISSEQLHLWNSHLSSKDIDDVLGTAEFMGRKLGSPSGHLYLRFFEQAFSNLKPSNTELSSIMKRISKSNLQIATLNYDTILDKLLGLEPILLSDDIRVGRWMRREASQVLHLHGVWDKPSSCVLGIRDYEAAINDESRSLLQKSLASFARILFVGCGGTFEDPNFSALITWLRENNRAAAPQHFALVKQDEVEARLADPAWSGFVEPLSYGDERSDLPVFLNDIFPIKGKPRTKTSGTTRAARATAINKSIITGYLNFIIKDCGQMTIEGVRADLKTAQRRFDLEKLFVPLNLNPIPPLISDEDPEKKEKLEYWAKENPNNQNFETIFEQHKRLALLALPGGGKTLLLKRLAVAYADRNRRFESSDNLPEIDVIPILIRCREWKDQIRRPIITLLNSFGLVNGQPDLDNFGKAITPFLENGQALLLVDGLDEVHDDADRSIFVENLENFINKYPNIRLVVTSREAGFDLVAPCISRFCHHMRVAPLNDFSITLLCTYWHRLMTSDSAEGQTEAVDVAKKLIQTLALRRLAENPLLLTMLLVVKHGAGKLPPDRVSLYDRAVEVLLDTWNIKGHEALNSREAVPQLAYVAFALLRQGKQTATERELLQLIDDSRVHVPQIRRYAKDSPFDFMKRVELRSSLLVEAGYRREDSQLVPFYQFRHLTFQEYLAAVAAVDGHYPEYNKDSTAVSALEEYLLLEEWKEVIPMATVLAKKRSEPIITKLIACASADRHALTQGNSWHSIAEWEHKGTLPPALSLLMQCLIEEAEIPPDAIAPAMSSLVYFAKGCYDTPGWKDLCRGPYIEDLLCVAWNIYDSMEWPSRSWMRNSIGSFEYLRYPREYWSSAAGIKMIRNLQNSSDDREIARGLLIYGAYIWETIRVKRSKMFLSNSFKLDKFIYNDNPSVWSAAFWVQALLVDSTRTFQIDAEVRNRIMQLWLRSPLSAKSGAANTLLRAALPRRGEWTPNLNEKDIELLKSLAQLDVSLTIEDPSRHKLCAYLIAFYHQGIWTDIEIEDMLIKLKGSRTVHLNRVRGFMLSFLNPRAGRFKSNRKAP